MQATRAKRLAAAVAAVVVATLVVVAGPSARAETANPSVFIYDNSGTAVIGTLQDGVFDQVQVLDVGYGWTAAAASRDTLMLYNRSTGAVETGRISDGIYVPMEHTSMPTGFTKLVASCDSFLIYKSNGYRMWGTLTGGTATTTVAGYGFSAGWNQITASCDTIRFEMNTNHTTALGTLAGGWFTQTAGYSDPGSNIPYTHAVSTSDSFLKYAASWGYGYWGHAVGGDDGYSNSTSSFFTGWDILAGTGDTALFYDNASGLAATATLSGGQYTSRYSYGFSAGWDLMAGAK